MDMLTRTVKKLDCSSNRIALEIDGRARLKTVCGGILSLILWIATGIGTVYFLVPVFCREDPSINVFRQINAESVVPLADLDFQLIPLSFGRYNKHLAKALQFEAVLSKSADGVNTTNYVIPFVKCKDSLCLDLNTVMSSNGEALLPEDSVLIKSKNDEFSNLTVKIKTCDPESEAFMAYFSKNNSFEVKISAKTHFLQANDFDSPVKSNLFEFISQFSLGQPTKTTFLFSKNTVVSDRNYFFVSKESESYFGVDSFKQSFIKPRNSVVGLISLETSMISERTTVIYPKIQAIMAEIVAFFQILSSVVQITLKPFSKYHLLSKIAKYKKRNPDLEANNYVLVDKIANQTSIYINRHTYKQKIPSLTEFIVKQIVPWSDELKTNFELNVSYLDFEQLMRKLDKTEKLEHQLNQMITAH